MGGPALIDEEYHDETDNFQAIKFEVNDVTYYSPENYFQCQKTTNKEDFEKIRTSGSGADCWAAAQYIKLRDDWEEVKVQIMYDGNKAKFEQHPDLVKALIGTKGPVKFGGSTGFWNKWNGLIMERLRSEFRKNGDEDKDEVARITKLMDKYKSDNKK
jgi:hypothetical protein